MQRTIGNTEAMPENWRAIRWKCILRDHLRCQRCGRSFPHGHGLTVHHIRSRAEGGGNHPANLITLCVDCHDWIEGRALYTHAAIMGSLGAPDAPSMARYEHQQIGFEYRRPGRHEIWITGRWYGLADEASLLEMWRYREWNDLLLKDWIDLSTGERYIGRVCDMESGGGWATRDETGT